MRETSGSILICLSRSVSAINSVIVVFSLIFADLTKISRAESQFEVKSDGFSVVIDSDFC